MGDTPATLFGSVVQATVKEPTVIFPTTQQKIKVSIIILENFQTHDVGDLQIKQIKYVVFLMVPVLEYICHLSSESGTPLQVCKLPR